MQPESSDGFASVGTILPEEGAALLPGGSFRFMGKNGGEVCQRSAEGRQGGEGGGERGAGDSRDGDFGSNLKRGGRSHCGSPCGVRLVCGPRLVGENFTGDRRNDTI